jgi:hypothetical protein
VKDFDANYSLLSPFICQAVGNKEERRIDKTKSQVVNDKLSKETSASSSSTKTEISSWSGENTTGSSITNSFAVTKHDAYVKSVTLQGHQGEVFICLWNPITQQLASG